jgi:hypothetical protein
MNVVRAKMLAIHKPRNAAATHGFRATIRLSPQNPAAMARRQTAVAVLKNNSLEGRGARKGGGLANARDPMNVDEFRHSNSAAMIAMTTTIITAIST